MCIWITCRIWCHRSGMGSEILHFYKLTNDVNAVWPSTTLWAARFYQPNRHRVMKFYLISLFPKEVEVAQLCPTLWNPMESPWDSSGQDTEVGHPSLLQGIFPTQGLNPGFLYCRQILHQLSHQGNPRILEWVAYPFSSGPSQAYKEWLVSTHHRCVIWDSFQCPKNFLCSVYSSFPPL